MMYRRQFFTGIAAAAGLAIVAPTRRIWQVGETLVRPSAGIDPWLGPSSLLDAMAEITASNANATAEQAEWFRDQLAPDFGSSYEPLPRVTVEQIKRAMVEQLERAELDGYIPAGVADSYHVERDPADPRKFIETMRVPVFSGLASSITIKT